MKKRGIMLCCFLTAALIMGCSSEKAVTDPDGLQESDTVSEQSESSEEATVSDTSESQEGNTVSDTSEATGAATASDTADQQEESLYFTRGVYEKYAKEAVNPPVSYFYVFTGENTGYTTDDEVPDRSIPFTAEQLEGRVKFSFGGYEDAIEDTLIVHSFENGVVTGAFEDGLELVFEPIAGADPDNFDIVEYYNSVADADGLRTSEYHDPNGWSIRYDKEKFEITQKGANVFIVYQGEAPGSNVITVTYTAGQSGEEAIKELVKPYGDKATYDEIVFPGTEDVKGYYASTPVDTEGSGSYMEAYSRDYMEGSLIFEIDCHQGNDERMNMEVSDALSSIIFSIRFE